MNSQNRMALFFNGLRGLGSLYRLLIPRTHFQGRTVVGGPSARCHGDRHSRRKRGRPAGELLQISESLQSDLLPEVSLGDISIELKRGHYHRGTTDSGCRAAAFQLTLCGFSLTLQFKKQRLERWILQALRANSRARENRCPHL